MTNFGRIFHEGIAENEFNVSFPTICYNEAKKEDKEMSSMCVLFLGKEIYMASDSNSTLINGETKYEYQKLFPFKNGVFGVVGINSVNTNSGLRNIGEVIKEKLPDTIISITDFEQIIKAFSEEYTIVGNYCEVIVIMYDKGKAIRKQYVFMGNEFIIRGNEGMLPNDFTTYATNRATFEKGNENFKVYANENPKEALTKYIRFNEGIELFINNTRYIGGPVQMYKVTDEGVENMSEKPFDAVKV